MFLGPGGSGKSSLLDGLMDQPLRLAESTALADVMNIKYHWVEAADAAEDAWRLMKEEDEVQELASLCRLAVKEEIKRPQGAAAGVNTPVHTASTSSSDQDAQKAAQILEEVSEDVVQEAWQEEQEQSEEEQKQSEEEQEQSEEKQEQSEEEQEQSEEEQEQSEEEQVQSDEEQEQLRRSRGHRVQQLV